MATAPSSQASTDQPRMVGRPPFGSDPRVAVIWGGPSAEAEVSRVSANAVTEALRARGYLPSLLELTASLPATLAAESFPVVFPVTHGPFGEDGRLQGVLEVLGVPYVGSDVLGSALSASKPHARLCFAAAGLPVAPARVVDWAARSQLDASALRAAVGAAVVVKPASGGSAIGVRRVPADAADADVLSAIDAVLADGDLALVEQWVAGLEVTCGVLELAAGAVALPPTLIEARAADWYDFRSKYAAGGSLHRCPAPLPEPLTKAIQGAAVAAHQAVGARDLSRVDFLVRADDAGAPLTLLEINTLPGMTSTSLFPEAAAVAGIAFDTLCAQLVERARSRSPHAPPVALPMPPPV